MSRILEETSFDYLREICSGRREIDFIHFEGVRGRFIRFTWLYSDYYRWCSYLLEEPLPMKYFRLALEDRVGKRLIRKGVRRIDGKKCNILGVFEVDLLQSA